GRPIAGAWIAVAGASVAVVAVSDPDGKFALVDRPGVWLVVSADGFVAGNARATDERLTVELEAAQKINGTVAFADGRPVAGVTLEAQGPVTARSFTRGDGSFTLRGLATGRYKVRLRDSRLPPTSAEAAAGEDNVTLVVRSSKSIAGRVVNPRGEPVGGVVVRAISASRASLRAIARADGSFVLEGVTDGLYTLVANPPSEANQPYSQGQDYTSARQDGVPAGSTSIELVLNPGLAIEGVLVDEGGAPVSGVWLATGVRTTCTNETGQFVLRGLPPADYRIHLPPPNPKGLRLLDGEEEYRAGTRDLRLVALAGTEVRGTVVDERGRPIAGAIVQAVGPDGSRRRALTKGDGSFAITGVHAKTVRVNVTAEGYAASSVEDVLAGSGAVRVALARK
ncbi:MAG: carboxypeptidase regulatory-like domain-containing protein, partial [Planctomycetota bacterium]